MALFEFGEVVPGSPVRVLNEREARGGAGLLFAGGLAMFVYSVQTMDFRFSQLFITFALVDFFVRVVVNPRFAPTLVLARLAVSRQAPEYVGAAQKRFAWSIGLLLSAAMFLVVVVWGVMTPWKMAICGLCLVLMFSEAAFGICLGCVLYAWLTGKSPVLCPGDVCQVRRKEPIQRVSWAQGLVAAVAVGALGVGVVNAARVSEAPLTAPVVHAGPESQLLEAAEVIRAALADDRTDGIPASAGRALVAAEQLDGAGRDDLLAGARALVRLGPTPALAPSRQAFQQLMRGLVDLVSANPRLQAGLVLFECPMTVGYQRWVQASPRIDNPYQGHRMRTCGSAVARWSVEAMD
jgi:hypothetical protein